MEKFDIKATSVTAYLVRFLLNVQFRLECDRNDVLILAPCLSMSRDFTEFG